MHPADTAEAPGADSAPGDTEAPGADTDPGRTETPGTPPPPPTAPSPVVPSGWSRRKKILAWVAGSLAVVLLLAATGGYLVYLNGSTSAGLQDSVGSVLQQDGFKVRRTGTAGKQAVSHTVIRYHAGQEAEALLLAKDVHGASLSQVSGPPEALGTGTLPCSSALTTGRPSPPGR